MVTPIWTVKRGSEKGFEFFQKFIKNNGMLEELEVLGIEDGDTVEIYGWSFEYFR